MTSEQENVLVERWHIERFLALDFDWGQVQMLLAWGTEPHAADRLMRRDGKPTSCTPELALRILQPEDDPVLLGPVVH